MIILESVFVGFYSLLISVIILKFFNYSMLLNAFIIGFFKHFLSGIFGLHQYYCSKHNIKCDKLDPRNLIIESICEGIIFVVLYFVVSKYISGCIIFFIIGILLHISFEKLGIHSSFCKSHCKKIKYI